MITRAIIFATLAHENQKRKCTDVPYILHPLEAGIITSQLKYDVNNICAALLHDTIEDAKVSYESLKLMFNERIADLVKSQSEDKSKSWKERKQHTITFLKEVEDEDIKLISLADKLANARALQRDYLMIKDALWERFNVTDKNEHKWYYEELVKSLESLSKYALYQEFKALVLKIFE
ncbi:MAG: bifunctional (p)ppGpp synthetase/guanosine-3',5'-bis(diphosphate) 3'-pyrophosphohydrolase [Epulopiscium sp.]|nr:bifunctional (p)ppGpp synthetase/guanosine-3',5'-bis(diphosphate) 3'-pyrophosphohydrolase [Candidatus Epulonipiscium sp.]